jgi:hypothetical protein
VENHHSELQHLRQAGYQSGLIVWCRPQRFQPEGLQIKLDMTAEIESIVEPNGVGNYIWREPVPIAQIDLLALLGT